MTASYYIILNAHSGSDDAETVKTTIIDALTSAGRQCHLFLVDHPERLEQVAENAIGRAEAEQGVVVAAGGDGAIHTVAEKIAGRNCLLGVIPQGTFNYFARVNFIPEKLEDALQVLIDGHSEPVQIGRVNDHIFLVNASIGLYSSILEEREEFKAKFRRSRIVALMAGAYSLFTNRQILSLTLDADVNKRHVFTPSLFVGNNSLQLGHIGIKTGLNVNSGCLTAVIPKPVSAWGRLKWMYKAFLGKLVEDESIDFFRFREMTVDVPRYFRRKVKMAMDGEIFIERYPLRFSVSPEPLRLIKPKFEPA